MKHLQRHLLVLLLALLPGVASFAGEAADSLYIFRFVQGKDAFYVPWHDGQSARVQAARQNKELLGPHTCRHQPRVDYRKQ